MVKGTSYVASFPTLDEAEDWEADSRRRLKRGLPVEQPTAMVGGADVGTIGNTTRAIIKEHWEPQRDSKSQIANAKTFLSWVGPSTPVTEALSAKNITAFRTYLIHERGLAPTTVNRYGSMLRIITRKAKVPWDPELFPHDAKSERENGRDRFFTKAEFETIVAWMDQNGFHRQRDFFIFLTHTGARPWSEGEPLKWSDVHDGKVTFRVTKTGRPRTVPLSPRALEAVNNQRALGKNGPWTGLRCRTMVSFWKIVKDAIPGLDDSVIYTCRHTCASWQVQDGISLYHVGVWMGHTNPLTTQRYAKLSPEHLVANMATFA
jgi:integrase